MKLLEGSQSRFLLVLFLAACYSEAGVISQIYVSIGPDAGAPSPSYAGYTANAQAGVSSGGKNVGGDIATTPIAYNVLGSGTTATVPIDSIIATSFPSWLSVADPAGSLTGESGNNLFWSVLISGSPGLNDISLADVAVSQNSNDPLNTFGDGLGGPFTFSYSGSTYSASDVGIMANGTRITSGLASAPVNEIVLTGFSSFLSPATLAADLNLTFSGTDQEQMQQIDSAFAGALGNFSINTCFSLNGGASTCDVVDVVTTPEPGSIKALSFALALLGGVCWLHRAISRERSKGLPTRMSKGTWHLCASVLRRRAATLVPIDV
jgi:hypothetical protein